MCASGSVMACYSSLYIICFRRAYGKAGNGNEMETGNGNWETGSWKQKWKCNLLAVVVLTRFNCCWLLFLVLSLPPVFDRLLC